MSGLALEDKAVKELLATYSETPIRLENVTWDPDPADPPEWVEVWVVSGSGRPASIGNVNAGGGLRNRYIGVITAHFYVPEASGTRRQKEIMDIFAAIFENQYAGGLTFREASVQGGGESPNAGSVRKVMTIPFQRDETT